MIFRIAFAAVAIFAAVSSARADSTINGLSAGASLTGTELIPMFQESNPAVTTTPNALKTYIGGGTVTSITAGCGSSTGGSAITTSGMIVASEPIDLETGSNFPIPNADCGYLVN